MAALSEADNAGSLWLWPLVSINLGCISAWLELGNTRLEFGQPGWNLVRFGHISRRCLYA